MGGLTDVTVVVPRLDLGDEHRNRVQAYCQRLIPDVPVVIGLDPEAGRTWSMSRALNAGRAQVTTPKMILTPADYELPPGMIDRASALLDAHPWWGPFNSVWQITKEQTLAALATWADLPPRDGMTLWGVCMPTVAVRVDVFDDVGGMDSRFEGWGPEDAALRRKLGILYGPPPDPEWQASELWCQRGPTTNRTANVSLYEAEYLNAASPADARRIIAASRQGR